MSTVQIVVAIITGIAAFTGAILGIINTLHRIRQEGVRLRVRPKLIKHACDWAAINIGVEVVNLSSFPVTIVDVGLVFKDKKRDNESIVHFIKHQTDPEPEIPIELAPRKIMSWEHPLGPWNITESAIFSSIKKVYAVSEYGDKVYGTDREFQKLRRKLKWFSKEKRIPFPQLSRPEG